jgi:hypothetical protein
MHARQLIQCPTRHTQAMVFNNVRDPTVRWPLSVALSVDDGVTWPWVRDLEPADAATTTEEAAQAAAATQAMAAEKAAAAELKRRADERGASMANRARVAVRRGAEITAMTRGFASQQQAVQAAQQQQSHSRRALLQSPVHTHDTVRALRPLTSHLSPLASLSPSGRTRCQQAHALRPLQSQRRQLAAVHTWKHWCATCSRVVHV